MRVLEIDKDYDLEVKAVRFVGTVKLDGQERAQANSGDGQRVLLDFESGTILVLTPRGTRKLVPFSNVRDVELPDADAGAKLGALPVGLDELANQVADQAIATGKHDAGDTALRTAAKRIAEDRMPAEKLEDLLNTPIGDFEVGQVGLVDRALLDEGTSAPPVHEKVEPLPEKPKAKKARKKPKAKK